MGHSPSLHRWKTAPTGFTALGLVCIFLIRALLEAGFPQASLSGGDVDEGPPVSLT